MTKTDIENIVGTDFCSQGDCANWAVRIVKKLITSKSNLEEAKYKISVRETIELIKETFNLNGYAIIWPYSGNDAANNPRCHSYIVFSINPLEAFCGWVTNLEYFSETAITSKIEETIKVFGKIGVSYLKI